ncbi:hypothetical protein BLA24_19185, partial [Streptomyces cinnamoneus]
MATVVERFRPRGSSALTTPEELADATPREVLHALGESLTEIATTSVIGLIGSIVASAMLTVVVSRRSWAARSPHGTPGRTHAPAARHGRALL